MNDASALVQYAGCHIIWKLQHTAVCDFSGYCDTVTVWMRRTDNPSYSEAVLYGCLHKLRMKLLSSLPLSWYKKDLRRGDERQLSTTTTSHQASHTKLTSKQPILLSVTTNGFLRHAQFCLFHLLRVRDGVSAHNSHRLRWTRGLRCWLHHRVNDSSVATCSVRHK